MQIFKNFKLGEPKTQEHLKLRNRHNVMFLYDEDGNEWYGCQKAFSDDTIKIAFDNKGIIRSIAANKDVSTLWPVGLSVAEVRDTTANRRADISGNWVFNGEGIVKRVYTPDEHQAQAEAKKTALIDYANKKTQAWQTQLMLNLISEDDKNSLIEWMVYVKKIQTIDISLAPNITWPESPLSA
ncbi:tail fiber assembly protein [Serratia sp. PAMC26656]|uniref:tail fiber assembly protein n=1 Tax=Serratia sp. PAMC26656 TaxID=2775909 RepID=UPI0018F52237|nr:tail fiber assembly protein [Serratia sp. PAMC26656]MBJ7892545.1 tail fiber assembly protein [Serratia sp. PAMC26656]